MYGRTQLSRMYVLLTVLTVNLFFFLSRGDEIDQTVLKVKASRHSSLISESLFVLLYSLTFSPI